MGGASFAGMHAVFFGLKRAFQSSLEWMKGVFAPFDLTPARFDMLYLLNQEEWFYQGELQSVLGVSAATVSRMLKSLRQLGLVESDVDPDDRRRRLVGLTELGSAVLARAIEAVMGSGIAGLAVASSVGWNWWSRRITNPEIRQLLKRLDRIRNNFRDSGRLRYGASVDD